MSGESYSGALEAAGVTVHECKWFGSYQGTWVADVTLPDGRRGLISGYYGSCSGCDAFEAEFGYDSHEWNHTDGKTVAEADCPECAEYKRRLAKFGEGYLSDFKTPEDAARERYEQEWSWSSYDDDVERGEFILARVTDPAVREALQARITKERT